MAAAARRALLPLGLLLIGLGGAGCGSPSVATPPPTSTAPTATIAPAATGTVAPSPTITAAPTIAAAPTATVGSSPAASPSAIDPADFVAQVDNPWFPLVPGTTLTYKGTKDGEQAIDSFEITAETKVIDGVTCMVIRDTLTLDGKLAEKTDDWYAQDREGNVWYFGEDTAELGESGKVASTEGSWQSGVDGAQPGIFMPADPRIGQSFQQEFYAGQAEDHFVVLLVSTPVKVRYGSFTDALLTAEWTPLEPDVLGEKYYVKGVGLVKELDVTGGVERLELVSVRAP